MKALFLAIVMTIYATPNFSYAEDLLLRCTSDNNFTTDYKIEGGEWYVKPWRSNNWNPSYCDQGRTKTNTGYITANCVLNNRVGYRIVIGETNFGGDAFLVEDTIELNTMIMTTESIFDGSKKVTKSECKMLENDSRGNQ